MSMDAQQRTRLSKALARILRHKPWLYELELDDEGWTSLAALLEGLHGHRQEWQNLTVADIEEVIATSTKRRYEIQGERIRALYGHSIPGRLLKTSGTPPETLYHGTSTGALGAIRRQGLKPMSRQYVHLSADSVMALEVGRRKRGETAILTIHAGEAHRQGVIFYSGNEHVWLADAVPPEFIDFVNHE
jgi:putative RNA 2'-phosphotransferase